MTILGTIWSAAPLPALGNDRRSRKARAALAKKQRAAARLLCLAEFRPHEAAQWLGMTGCSPRAKQLVVTLTRVHPPGKGIMDTDGLTASFKHVRDGIADWLGVDDSPRSGIKWRYNQVQSNSPIPHSKAKWWAHFESREFIKTKTPMLDEMERMSAPRVTDLRDVVISNHTPHRISGAVSIEPDGTVRVVLR